MLEYNIDVYLRHTEMENMYTRELIELVTNDFNGNIFNFTIYQTDKSVYDLTGKTVTLIVKSSKGTVIEDNCELTDAIQGKVKITLPSDMFCEDGTYYAELQIWKGTSRITTLPFDYTVRLSLDTDEAVKADNRFNLLQEALNNVADANVTANSAMVTANSAKTIVDDLVPKANQAAINAQAALDRAQSIVTQGELSEKVKINGTSTNVNFIENENGSIPYIDLGNKLINLKQDGRLFDYSETPLSEGYKKYEIMAFEKGSVNPIHGTDLVDIVSIRTKLFKFNSDMIIRNKKPTLYRWRVYKYSNDGTYSNAYTSWNSQAETLLPLEDYSYRLQIATTDGSNIVFEDAIRSITVLNPNDKVKNLEEIVNYVDSNINGKSIEYNKTPMYYGFNKFMNFDFEIGGITPTNGVNDGSLNCCRTDFLTIKSVKAKNTNNSNFRYRFVVYNSSKVFKSITSWLYNTDYDFSCNEDEYVRIVCATKTEPNMNIEECLSNIKFFNPSDELKDGAMFPHYYKDYLKTKTDRIRMLLQDGANKVVFGVTTDTHYNPSADFNRNMTANIIKYINDECNIDTFIHLGDLTSENSIKNNALSYQNYVTKEFQRVAPVYLPIKGNHDDNHYSTFANAITSSDIYSTTFRTLKDVVYGGNGTYYYHDKPFEKIRFIMLNSSDFVYKKHATEDKLAEVQLAYGYEQLQWLVGTALDVPQDYKIIICSHAGVADTQVTIDYPTTSPQTKPRQKGLMENIIRCYNAKADLNFEIKDATFSATPEYYEGFLSGLFSKMKGEIIGFLSGHEHIDDVQTITSTDVKNIFFLNNSGNFADSILNRKYQPERELGTIAEETYDIVILDTKARQYTIVRIGAGEEERVITY